MVFYIIILLSLNLIVCQEIEQVIIAYGYERKITFNNYDLIDFYMRIQHFNEDVRIHLTFVGFMNSDILTGIYRTFDRILKPLNNNPQNLYILITNDINKFDTAVGYRIKTINPLIYLIKEMDPLPIVIISISLIFILIINIVCVVGFIKFIKSKKNDTNKIEMLEIRQTDNETEFIEKI